MKMLVISCIKNLERIRMSKRGKSSEAGPKEGWRYAVGKFRKAVGMKISIKGRKKYKISAEYKC